MPKQIPQWAQSSVNSGQLSTTIDGALKLVGGVLATIAIAKGIDPLLVSAQITTIQGQIDSIIAQYITIAPAAYAAWHSAHMLFGASRKVFILVFGKAIPVVVTDTPTVPDTTVPTV